MVAKDTDQAPGAGVETDGEACIPFDAADQIEIRHAKGWTDALPVAPPTPPATPAFPDAPPPPAGRLPPRAPRCASVARSSSARS